MNKIYPFLVGNYGGKSSSGPRPAWWWKPPRPTASAMHWLNVKFLKQQVLCLHLIISIIFFCGQNYLQKISTTALHGLLLKILTSTRTQYLWEDSGNFFSKGGVAVYPVECVITQSALWRAPDYNWYELITHKKVYPLIVEISKGFFFSECEGFSMRPSEMYSSVRFDGKKNCTTCRFRWKNVYRKTPRMPVDCGIWDRVIDLVTEGEQ